MVHWIYILSFVVIHRTMMMSHHYFFTSNFKFHNLQYSIALLANLGLLHHLRKHW
jgi:hypothetical protein